MKKAISSAVAKKMTTMKPVVKKKTTAKINRRQIDQEQVDRLKSLAYQRLVEDLQMRFDR